MLSERDIVARVQHLDRDEAQGVGAAGLDQAGRPERRKPSRRPTRPARR